MTKTLYIDGNKIGEVMDIDYTLDGEDAIVTNIPAGNSEVVVPITLSNVDKFMEIYRKVFKLSDAEIFEQYLIEQGYGSPEDFDDLNVLSLTLVGDGQGGFRYTTIVFDDGSVWTP